MTHHVLTRDLGNMLRNPWTEAAVHAANKETGTTVEYCSGPVTIDTMDWADAAEAYEVGYYPDPDMCSFWITDVLIDLSDWWACFEKHDNLLKAQHIPLIVSS